MQNTGIIEDPRSPESKSLDYIMGGETNISSTRLVSSWNDYLPQGEVQYGNGWDSMSCVSFSCGHIIEAQVIWLIKNGKVPTEIVDTLKARGYFTNPADLNTFKVSKRALAIMSGTTKQGNYFQKVWDTARKVGLIPDKDLPMGGATWEEFIGAPITQEMKTKGLDFLKYFEIKYAWLNYDGQSGFSEIEIKVSQEALQQAPPHIGIPIPAGHAIMMYSLHSPKYGSMDHYIPFFREDERPVNFAIKGFVDVKKCEPEPVKPKHTFTKALSFGMKSEEVRWLQKALIYEGLLKKGLDTGNFLAITKKAVCDFQEKYPVDCLYPIHLTKGTGYCGELTRKKLNFLYG